MRALRSGLVAIVTAVAIGIVGAAPAWAVPTERTRSIVSCEEDPGITLVMHPGGAAVQWDLSVEEVANAPTFNAKYIAADIYLDGEYALSFTKSRGEKVGLGEPLNCTFEVHQPGFDAYGIVELVRLRPN